MVKSLRYVGLLILCATVLILMEVSSHAAPRVEVEQTVHDAGTVPEGMDVIHEFLFRNAGDKDLVIKPKPC